VAAAVRRMLPAVLPPGAGVACSEALTQERSVWRCRLHGVTGPPRSVIVRTRREIGGWRTDPSYLRSDYAATAFLADRCPGVSPQILAADVGAGLYITEDLGAGPSLGDLLAGTDRSEATKGLLAFAVLLGRMHAATAGLDGEYYQRRHQLGPIDPSGPRTYLGEISVEEASGRVLGAQVHDRTAPRRARGDMEAILTVLAQPGAFLALSNGDPCPYNCLIPNGIAHLIDFELAGYRHALLDVAYLHLGFHWCYQPGQIPADMLREAETAYRREASAGIPVILDEPVYQRALTAAAAAWAVLAAGMVMRHLDRGRLASADATRHVATMREYVAKFGRASWYPALSRWISDLVTALEREEATGHRGPYRAFNP
jgi:hypothetical protein